MAKRKNYSKRGRQDNRRKLPKIHSCLINSRIIHGTIRKNFEERPEENNLLTGGYSIKKINRTHG